MLSAKKVNSEKFAYKEVLTMDPYHIPANYTDAGRLFGLFEIRNTRLLFTISVVY
jgi:hypothetical protein